MHPRELQTRPFEQTPLLMLPLDTSEARTFPSDQTLFIEGVVVPEQEVPRGAYLAIGVGDKNCFFWAIDDAMARTRSMQKAGDLAAAIIDKLRVDCAEHAATVIRALATAHVVRIEPVLIVPPRQVYSLRVYLPERNRFCNFSKPLDVPLAVSLVCSFTRDVG
jgi:hypothetical protein